MTNYVEITSKYFPTAQVYVQGEDKSPTNYNDLIWITPPISQFELDTIALVEYKTEKILAFSEYARDEIVNGFMSSALGYPHRYDSEPEDQLNLIGAVATNSTMLFSCYPTTAGKQTINFNGTVIGTNPTGVANNTVTRNAQINVNGVTTYISLQGNTMQTFNELITQLNLDADFSAVATAMIVDGNIVITSKQYGSTSTVEILDIDLFSSLVGYVNVQTAVNGTDALSNPKEYKLHTNAQLLQILNDGKDVKLTILQKFAVKKAQILAASNISAVDAIIW